MRQSLFSIIVFVLFSNTIVSQTIDFGSWNILNVKYSLNDKTSFFGEGQLRSLKFYDNFHYYEYKGGINYKVYKNVKLTIGAGSYQTYKEGGNFVLPKNNDEFRIWPQVILFQSIGSLKVEQRYRAELRWTSNGYRNRFRYRVGVSYPFGTERNETNTNHTKLVQAMNCFSLTKNLILKETGCYLPLIINLLKQLLYRLVTYINSIIKLTMRRDVILLW